MIKDDKQTGCKSISLVDVYGEELYMHNKYDLVKRAVGQLGQLPKDDFIDVITMIDIRHIKHFRVKKDPEDISVILKGTVEEEEGILKMSGGDI